MHLSQAQEEAVRHMDSPALVIAGAGSGKTRTLTAKIAHLLEKGFSPDRILAITFTNKAAEEMKTRLVRQTGLASDAFPWVRTYHSACLQILKKHAERAGYTPPVQILAGYQQQKTLQEIVVRLNIDKKETPRLQYKISMAKNHGDPESFIQDLPEIERVQTREVFRQYEKALMAMNAVDFDNILLKVRDMLRDHADIREAYRSLFRFILVDEYQDSNNLQEELTRLLLGHGNLFCVGDDWQAVYGFRGSNVNHFLRFQKTYPNARLFRLEENYRSADEIVQAAGALIQNNPRRMEKHCYSEKFGGSVELYYFYNENEEAKWVGRKISTLIKSGVPMDRIAVIYRTKFCSLAFEKIFRAMNIPYRMLGSKGFFERMEILDLNAYLTAAVFPKDDASFERILNTPKRGIGPAMVKKMQQVRGPGDSLQDAARHLLGKRLLSSKIHDSLEKLICVLDEIQNMAPDAAIRQVMKETGYLDYLEQLSKADKGDFTARQENIEELIYTAGQKENLIAYLEEAALIREDREEEEEKGRGVNLATVHASKGLEFHSVFVVACEEELFPHWKSMQSAAELEEERRLMYVAMTRAERCLFLSASEFRRGRPSEASRFLGEIQAVLPA
ncbi:ATP-dependent helicase [Desulfobotulus sp.]|jgi:DNA helicase-2/ATP-dependent DNA helicase PcrA|uniref:ATP-dependent helicase n=1 Tax=Desulfobotulus sp. TaxID=1940337 RepID=UPI002A36EED3|nr:ATP-dependent helicase [Desulfobotulus sp.]MDY0163970.1 ATP-dependent helicase [Desulfobotulus sp.]